MLNQLQKEMLHLHACLLLQYQQPKEAVVILKSLILTAPDFIPAQYSMALASLEAEQFETAIEWCTTLIPRTKKKKKAALYLCLSRAYWRLGNSQQAKIAYQEYLDNVPKKNLNLTTTK